VSEEPGPCRNTQKKKTKAISYFVPLRLVLPYFGRKIPPLQRAKFRNKYFRDSPKLVPSSRFPCRMPKKSSQFINAFLALITVAREESMVMAALMAMNETSR
jgi:hypothetical protein